MIHENHTEYEKCRACDMTACQQALSTRSTYIYKCRYGFTEAVSPLYNFGTLTGFLMMGQIFESGADGRIVNTDLSEIKALGEDYERSLLEIPKVSSDMVKSYVKIMTICAQYLTLSNAIPSTKPTIAETAKKFIFDNYRSKITINDICAEVGCSKSTLITSFKKQYGITVNNYITEVRLSEAASMLSVSEKPIGEIAAATGFSDQSYFSKVFSAKFGVSPSEYKAKE